MCDNQVLSARSRRAALAIEQPIATVPHCRDLLRQWFTRSQVIRQTYCGTGRGRLRSRGVCRLITEVRVGRFCRDGAAEFRLGSRVNGLLDIEGISEERWFRKISAVHPKPGRLALWSKSDRNRNVGISSDSSGR